ncbi:MAG: hypothetical protein BMS9Abin01_2566 [Gammaproteobacteria bacterium]|nr:MAG: hypothetical protein BMS9Abin01_2566 [Gammaproteobacteria bacterium]
MWEFDDFHSDSSGTVFRDVLMLALIGFVAMVIMLLPNISKTEDATDEYTPPGNVVVEMLWPDGLPVDVDLWVQAPNDVPVGFWNQGSEYFNLLRDDLGMEGDATARNYEVSYSRGIPAGDYTVNVHMYGPVPAGVVVPVRVVVSVKAKYDRLRQILETSLELERRNQEKTAFRFRLTGDGDLVPGSVTTLRRRLVTAPP